MAETSELRRALGPVTLWGLGVGYVIAGMYYGWNLGLPEGGPWGFLVATLLVTVLYVAFVLSYTELACAIPKAGGAFVYANRALGAELGFLAGVAQWIEFVFLPPTVAAAIGAYLNIIFPNLPAMTIAVGAYLLFTALNIYGVKQSAIVELLVTVVAVVGLLAFAGVALPHFSWSSFSRSALPRGWWGVFPALPYAIWFYIAIEGVANVAEEARNPQKDIAIGFISAILTLVVLAILTFFAAVGVAGWESVVYQAGSSAPSDSPLPLALSAILPASHWLFRGLTAISLFGLVASFHGIILVAGRATFEFGRIGYAPRVFGKTLPGRKTPAAALVFNMLLGLVALFTGRTADIILIAVLGALTMYILAMVSVFRLRKTRPDLERPFRVPLYPWVPGSALALALLCFVAMVCFNIKISLVYFGILALGFAWFFLLVPKSLKVAPGANSQTSLE